MAGLLVRLLMPTRFIRADSVPPRGAASARDQKRAPTLPPDSASDLPGRWTGSWVHLGAVVPLVTVAGAMGVTRRKGDQKDWDGLVHEPPRTRFKVPVPCSTLVLFPEGVNTATSRCSSVKTNIPSSSLPVARVAPRLRTVS